MEELRTSGKRNRKQRKMTKMMLKRLDAMLGEEFSGLFLAIILDLLNEFVKGVDGRQLRTIEIKLNDFFSAKYDFEKEEMVKDE
jgi:hypothetical protein